MLRHECFLERVHRVLSLPGTSAARVARVLDRCIEGGGDVVPKSVTRSALAIQEALVREGIPAARRKVAALRDQTRAPNTCGGSARTFADARPEGWGDQDYGPGYRILMFEKADDDGVQLLAVDGPEPVAVGAPRHVALLYFLFRKGEATLLEAVHATGTSALRATRVFYETRDIIGPEWLDQSDSACAPPSRRILRFREPVDVEGADILERRVRQLTVVPKAPSRRPK